MYPSPCDGDRERVPNTVKHFNEQRFFRETHQPYSLKQKFCTSFWHSWRIFQPDRGGFPLSTPLSLYAPVSHNSQIRFPAKLNNILCYATVLETGKHKEIYYIGAGLALGGSRDQSLRRCACCSVGG